MGALNGLPARLLALTLLAQAAAFYAVASRSEILPSVGPLTDFPQRSGGWTMVKEYAIEKEIQAVLRADDTVSRVYVNPEQTGSASLFIAFFKTQRAGQAPHSPKNCLPAWGWQPTEEGKLPIAVPGRADPIVVNRYVVERGDEKSVVLYWYQSHSRVIASEFAAKFWLVADAVRYRRSDTALVRITAPVRNGDTTTAEALAVAFARATYPDLAQQLPR